MSEENNMENENQNSEDQREEEEKMPAQGKLVGNNSLTHGRGPVPGAASLPTLHK